MTTNTLGSDPSSRSKPASSWLVPFAPMGFAAFSLSALVFFHVRQDAFAVQSALQHLYAALYRAFGFAPAVMFFGLVVLWSTIWLANGSLRRPLQRLGRLAAMAVLLGVLLNLGDGGVSPALHKGAIGAAVAEALVHAIGYWPSLVLVWAATFASLLLATDFFFQESFERLLAPARAEDAPAEDAGTAAAAAAAASLAPAPDADAGAAVPANVPAPAAEDDDATWRRRSYHERRAEREARVARRFGGDVEVDGDAAAAAPATDDEAGAVGAAADATGEPSPAPVDAGDAFGLSAARVVDAIDAAMAPDAAAVEADVPEALQRGLADGEGAPPSLRAARTPIVFPDEIEPMAAVAPVAAPLADEAPVAADADAHAAAIAPAPVDAVGAEPEAADLGFDAGGATSAAAVAAEAAPGAASDDLAAPAAAEAVAEAFAADGDLFVLVEPTSGDEDGGDAAAPMGEPLAAAAASEVGDDAGDDAGDEVAAAEAAVAIPRPQAAPVEAAVASSLDEGLVREAIELVTSTRRANTVFLQRKLRIDYELAAAVLVELAARGIVALDPEATHGRVLA